MDQNSYSTDNLIRLVSSVTPMTAKEYPALAQLSGEPREVFIIGHSLRHLSATTGNMQKAIELAEHGEGLDKDLLKNKLFSAVFSVCKLCEVLEVSGNELLKSVGDLAKGSAEQ